MAGVTDHDIQLLHRPMVLRCIQALYRGPPRTHLQYIAPLSTSLHHALVPSCCSPTSLLSSHYGAPGNHGLPRPRGGHLGCLGRSGLGLRRAGRGPTLASRLATSAWAFMAEVGGGGTGREGKRDGREGGKGEENGKGERGGDDDLCKDEISMQAAEDAR